MEQLHKLHHSLV